jgi:iron(III) transport system ATP-binding protein
MLKLENISKKFGDKQILEGINLEVKEGEIVSLLGQSGSGKSTLLNIIAGFEEANGGMISYQDRVLCDGVSVVEPQDRDIGFVFQNYALFPHLNIEKNIAFGIRSKDKLFRKQRVAELLELINMPGVEKKYPHQISGGQQQRVAIARVLARESELILFDEPFSSIDTTLKFKLVEEIKEIIKSHNKTAIFVTHCPKEATRLSDKIGYIEKGKIIQFDTPDRFYTEPMSKSISELFESEQEWYCAAK